MPDVSAAVLQSAIPEFIQIVSLIFGGCCTNVLALESILKTHPGSGTFLTFSQFIFVTIQNLGKFTEWPQKDGKRGWPRLKKREVPVFRWMGQVVLYLGISLLNNYAFGLKIPMTLHIIFRSGGLCVSMLTSYLVSGKRYSPGQILAGIMITVGIVLATLSAPSRRPAVSALATGSSQSWATPEYAGGIAVLSMALVLSAFLGVFQEETYRRYGKAWQEGLFYSHLLSIPFFLPFYSTLISTGKSYALSTPITLFSIPLNPSSIPVSLLASPMFSVKPMPPTEPSFSLALPSALLALGVNVLTQGLCIRGVNRLTAKRVSSTTVNLVLTVRKAISLAISVWFSGSGLTPGLAAGGGLVLLGTIIYSISSSAPTRSSSKSYATTQTDAKPQKGDLATAPVKNLRGVGFGTETERELRRRR